MAQLTDFIATCKSLDLQHGNINDLGSTLINQAITDALMEYSEYSPRGQRTATITIEIGDTEILLPADCLVLSDDTAYLLYYGYERTVFDVPGAYPLRARNHGFLGSNTPLSNTTDLPLTTSQSEPATIPISTSDLGRISIQLTTPAVAARSHRIRYDAYHVISNGPDSNTVPHRDRPKLRKLVLSYFYEARARQAIEAQDLPLAKECAAIAARYAQVKDEFVSALGGIC